MLALAFVIGIATRDEPTPAPRSSAPQPAPKLDPAATAAANGAIRLRDAMRNPASFELDHVTIIDGDAAVCYEYRSQNGFGGMSGGRAVLVPKIGTFSHSDSDGFDVAWNVHCGGKSGRDVVNAIRMFAM